MKKEITIPEHCFSIKEYEKSAWWRKKSDLLLSDTNCTCMICGRKRFFWQVRNKKFKRVLKFSVHHVSYENVPNEKETDLLILCNLCHTLSHDIFRYKNISTMYSRLAAIVKDYFRYDGTETFKPW